MLILQAPAVTQNAVDQPTGRKEVLRIPKFEAKYISTFLDDLLTLLDWYVVRKLILQKASYLETFRSDCSFGVYGSPSRLTVQHDVLVMQVPM